MKNLIFIFLVNSAFAQTGNVYSSSFKIEDVDQKSFAFNSPMDDVDLSLKSKSFIRSTGETIKLSKSRNKVFLTTDSDTLAVKIKNCIYSVKDNKNISYQITGRSLKKENEKILLGHIRFKGNEVQISVDQMSLNTDKAVIYLFLYKMLLEAKIINESNLFTTGILPGLL
jgi:tryptophanyl-tRNA synthetase